MESRKTILMMALIMAGIMIFLGTKIVVAGMTAVDYYNRGIDAHQKGNLDKAIVNYTKAIKLKPDFPFAYSNRGAAYDNKGNYDKAITDYNKAIKLKPKDADIYNSRGNTYIKRGNYDKAILDFIKAIKLKPNFANAYNNRGEAWRHKGNYNKAIADYKKAIKFKQNFANAYNNLAWLLATCPEVVYRSGGRAITLAEKAVTLSGGKNTNILDTLSAAYAEAGRFDKAVETQRRAIRMLKDRNAKIWIIANYEKRLHNYVVHRPWRE